MSPGQGGETSKGTVLRRKGGRLGEGDVEGGS